MFHSVLFLYLCKQIYANKKSMISLICIIFIVMCGRCRVLQVMTSNATRASPQHWAELLNVSVTKVDLFTPEGALQHKEAELAVELY